MKTLIVLLLSILSYGTLSTANAAPSVKQQVCDFYGENGVCDLVPSCQSFNLNPGCHLASGQLEGFRPLCNAVFDSKDGCAAEASAGVCVWLERPLNVCVAR